MFSGDHFTSLADKQGTTSATVDPHNGPLQQQKPSVLIHPSDRNAEMRVVSSTDPRQQREIEDQRRVDDLLAQPEICEALLDADVKRMLATLRSDPNSAQE